MLALNLLHRNRAPIGARQQCATPNSQAGPCLCSRGAQRVLRSCDMEYVMTTPIFSLPHAWGGTTCSVRAASDL